MAISWNSKKQTSIAMSLTKVDYLATSQTTRQAMWVSSFFGSIRVPQMKPIVIYDNNQSCISLSKNPIFRAHTKHIEIHHHLVQENIKEGFVKLVYCNTNTQYGSKYLDQRTYY
jgi:hypothetical protein